MNEINKAISTAQRHLTIGSFFSIFTWAIFISLIVATIGIAIPKLFHLEFLQSDRPRDAWTYSWVIGSIVAGFFTAAVVTWLKHQPRLEVAAEVDRRFRLKERLSSAISVTSESADNEVAQALIDDAQRHAETIVIADKFEYRPRLTGLLPLIPIAVMSILMFVVPDAQQPVQAASADQVEKEKAKLRVEAFKKKLEQTRKQIDAKGLKDASEDVKAIAKKFDKLSGDRLSDKKTALVKINDIKKDIEDRKKAVGDSKKFRENLNKLKDAGKGVAKKFANALADGNFEDANKAIKDLAKKLKDGKLTKAEAKRAAKELKNLADQMKKADAQRQQKMEDLKKQINKAIKEGDLDKAAQLQQKLEAEQQNEKQQQKMNGLAKQIQQAAEKLKNGQGDPQQLKQAMQQAAEALENMGEDLEDLKQQMQDMQNLEDLEDMIDGLKQPGGNPQEGNGPGQGQGKGNKPGNGMGAGQGFGKRPFEKDDTSGFKTGVRGKVGRGEKVITGNADGNNISGRSSAEVAELIQASETRDADPTENQKLSREHREHAEQYFRSLRDQ